MSARYSKFPRVDITKKNSVVLADKQISNSTNDPIFKHPKLTNEDLLNLKKTHSENVGKNISLKYPEAKPATPKLIAQHAEIEKKRYMFKNRAMTITDLENYLSSGSTKHLNKEIDVEKARNNRLQHAKLIKKSMGQDKIKKDEILKEHLRNIH